MVRSQLSVEINSEGREAAPSGRRENTRVGLEGSCHRENKGLPEVTSSAFLPSQNHSAVGLFTPLRPSLRKF